jgi:hypothetical protein
LVISLFLDALFALKIRKKDDDEEEEKKLEGKMYACYCCCCCSNRSSIGYFSPSVFEVEVS